MRTIYKYGVPPVTSFKLEMPKHSQFNHLGLQQGCMFAWFEVDTDQPMEKRIFYVVGTGHAIPADTQYVATVQQPPFVWHLYEPRS